MKLLILGSVFAILLLSTKVSAHVTGYSFNKAVGKYLVDVGYDMNPFVSGQTSAFNFVLSDAKTRDPIAFDDVWVRITHGSQVVFATGVHAGELASPTMLYTFGDPGRYDLNIRYEKNTDSIVETVFPIKVEPPANSSGVYVRFAGAGILGILVGFLLGFIGGKKMGSKKSKDKEKNGFSKK